MNIARLAARLVLLLPVGSRLLAATYEPASSVPPPPVREFRAGWVATVGNIDWPSRKDLSTTEQKAELLKILDAAAKLKMNAIIFQVRPACDALYASKLEPWSEYLTGTMGKPPAPFYDPLALAVAEAHRRGLELHAWLNPYRALHPNARSPISAAHISKTKPGLVRRYGQYLWLDPGEGEVQQHSLDVVMDVVRRYDVDGVHFDDYFYPYKESSGGKELDFPDDASWKKYGVRTRMSRDDWRRQNVNTFIERVYKAVKAVKPGVKFGVSPFGIWRPGNPEPIQGFDAFDGLYADSWKWLVNGWVDYLAPQLYWAIEPKAQSFPVLLKWWNDQNPKQRHIWPGLNTTKVRDHADDGEAGRTANTNRSRTRWPAQEIVSQIRLAEKQSVSAGHIHWNMKSLLRSAELQSSLAGGPYSEPALVPPCPWLAGSPPPKPRLSATVGTSSVKLTWSGPENVSSWLLQLKHHGRWTTSIIPAKTHSQMIDGELPEAVALSGIDRIGNQSQPAVLSLRR